MSAKTTQDQAEEIVLELAKNPHVWSGHVTATSHALALDKGVFTWDDPDKIARSLLRSARKSTAKKEDAFGSAMGMLNFYINRAGKNLDPKRREVLEKAKDSLRRIAGPKDKTNG